MSRKGKFPISIPKGVEVKISGNKVDVKGPKGHLTRELMKGITAKVEGSELIIGLEKENDAEMSKFHGLYRSLINNMVVGTSEGFITKLEMIGVGYRAAVQGHHLDISIGFSHPVKKEIPTGVSVKIEKGTLLEISGVDKQVNMYVRKQVKQQLPPKQVSKH
jgi:large subunit ribosomal protein L6